MLILAQISLAAALKLKNPQIYHLRAFIHITFNFELKSVEFQPV